MADNHELYMKIGHDRRVAKLQREDVCSIYGMSHGAVDTATAYYDGVVRGRNFRSIWDADTPRTKKAELNRALSVLNKEFNVHVEIKVQELFQKRMKEIGEGILQNKIDEARRVLAGRRGMISNEDYRLIKSILHPDSNATTEKKAKAFQLFCDLDVVLMNNKEDDRTSALPRTAAELIMAKYKQRTAAK